MRSCTVILIMAQLGLYSPIYPFYIRAHISWLTAGCPIVISNATINVKIGLLQQLIVKVS